MIEIGIATNKKLIDIYNMLVEGSLILAPAFQRSLVWSMAHKEAFIETILLGLPFPEVYFADGTLDLATKKSQTLVVDGQQRLHTIYEYVTGSDKLQFTRIPLFKGLNPAEQTAFFDYKIVIRDLGRLDNERIRDVFRRINSVQYALNAIEIQNALYEGAYINTAKEIAKGLEDLDESDLFREGEKSRMLDVQFVLLIMTTIEVGGYFAFSKEIEVYIKRFDDEYPRTVEMTGSLKKLIGLFNAMELPPDSIWHRRTSFFTLIVELHNLHREKQQLPHPTALRNLLVLFEKSLLENRGQDPGKNDFAAYYTYLYQATGSKKGRSTRGKALRTFIEPLFSAKQL